MVNLPGLPGGPRLPGLPSQPGSDSGQGNNQAQGAASGVGPRGQGPGAGGLRPLERGPEGLPPGIVRQLNDAVRQGPSARPGSAGPQGAGGGAPVSLPNPGGVAGSATTPAGPPALPGIGAPGGLAPGAAIPAAPGIVAQVVASATTALRTAISAVLPAATPPPPSSAAVATTSTALPQAAAAVPAATTTALLAGRIPAAAVATPPSTTPLSATALPASTPGTPPGAASGPATLRATPDVVATPMAPGATRPTDAIAPPVGRPDAAAAGRSDQAPRAAGAPAAASSAMSSATQATAAAVAGTTAATAGVGGMPSAVAPGQSPGGAPGVQLAAGGDRLGPQRADVVMVGVYTADGPGRRRLRRGVRVLPPRMTSWLLTMGPGGRLLAVSRSEEAAEEQAVLAAAMQWTFWTLAIVAYACLGLGLGIVALLPAGSVLPADDHRRWMGGFALAGLAAAAGAWWLGRRLARRGVASGPQT